MVSPPRCPSTAITLTPQNAHGITTTLSKQAHGHRRPASDHTPHARHRARPGAPAISPPHSPRVNWETHSPRAQPSHPCTRGTSVRPSCRRLPSVRATHAHPRSHARRPPPHTRKHTCLSRRCWIRRAAGRRARGRDQGPARTTNANRKHRHVRRPNTRVSKALWSFCEFARLPSPVA